jgi:hypothetical protein
LAHPSRATAGQTRDRARAHAERDYAAVQPEEDGPMDTRYEKFAPPNANILNQADDAAATITQEEAWAAVIGPSNTHGYIERFRRLSLGGSAEWHWPAFLTTLPWLLYRKMWIGALVYMVAPLPVLIALLMLLPRFAPGVVLAWWLGLALLPGVMANRWYFQHCKSRIRDVRARGGSRDQMLARLDAAGGTSKTALAVFVVGGCALVLTAVFAFAMPLYRKTAVQPRVTEALQAGYDVAAAIGQRYEQTRKMPSNAEVQVMAEGIAHPSDYLRGVDLEPSGDLVLHVEIPSVVAGRIRLHPETENGHVYWNCSTDDLKAYVPRTCRTLTRL